jgi:hypothetical protein
MTVTVQTAVAAVKASAARLSDAVRELVLIAVEDQPRDTEVHLVTVIGDAALDLAGEAEQVAALWRAGSTQDMPRARASRAVAHCQEHVNAMGAVLVRELAPPAILTDLAALGQNRGREAAAWATEIARCIDTCQQLLWTDIQPALLAYWRELADISDRVCAPGDEG